MKMVAVYLDTSTKKLFRSQIISIDVYEMKLYENFSNFNDDIMADVQSAHIPMEASYCKYEPISETCSNLLGYEYDNENKSWDREISEIMKEK